MSWEISHTNEAWINVQNRLSLHGWKRKLAEALHADDEAIREAQDEDCEEPHKVRGVSFYMKLLQDILVNAIMERIEDHRTCTNGGHEFYLDRDGWFKCSCDNLTESEKKRVRE